MKKRGRGRPTKLTPELVEELLRYLRMGVSIKSACDAAGINDATYRRWVVGSKDFCTQATRARSRGKIVLISQILTDKDWRAKAWYLERCWPAEFARTEDRRLPEEASAAAANKMPPLTVVLSTPDGKTKPVSFAQAEKVLCGGFPIHDLAY
jgi:hypothetical protein